jgi:DNA-directed RNA polymerase specialized sigma24 family protein
MAEEPISETPSSARLNAETGEHDDGLSAFAEVRPRLFGIAYRMLGSAAEAEDIVQDVWLRWQATDGSVVENPSAFLAKTTTKLVHQPCSVRLFAPRNLHRDVASRTGGHQR